MKEIRKTLASKIVIFDNLSPANKYADIVVNALIGNHFINQKTIDKNNNTLNFSGPRYLLLNQEFHRTQKKWSTSERKNRKVLILFGGSDPANLTTKILGDLLQTKENLQIEIITGPHFEHHSKLRDLISKYENKASSITQHNAIKNVAKIMVKADIVITSPGLTMFEALALNLPVIAFYQNELQKRVYKEFFSKLGRKPNNMLLIDEGFFLDPKDPAIQALHIGKGRFEVIEAISHDIKPQKTLDGNEISLRQVTDDDLQQLKTWRSNPLIYQYFYKQNKPLEWEEHYKWWMTRDNRIDWMILLNTNNRKKTIGSVNACNLHKNSPEIGIYIGEIDLWGKGIGRASLNLVIDWLRTQNYRFTQARVMMENIGSIKLFENVGFRRIKEDREGEWLYRKKL